jgi:hypothetical protein
MRLTKAAFVVRFLYRGEYGNNKTVHAVASWVFLVTGGTDDTVDGDPRWKQGNHLISRAETRSNAVRLGKLNLNSSLPSALRRQSL